MKVIKVICSNAGGKECQDCMHNNPHALHSYYDDNTIASTAACTLKKDYCPYAIDGGEGDKVACYPV